LIAALRALLVFAGAADAAPRCYGAASRDPEKRCVNRSLERKVTPTPEQATITPNVACTPQGELDACSVGPASGEPVVIVGDSHAAHWRAAMEVVARRKRWRVLEFARPHCPFSFASPAPTEAGASDCVGYNQRVIGYLAAHPEITRVFVSNNARLPMARRGIAYRLEGDTAALRALPSSVRDVWVIRDPPTDRATSHDCVDRSLRSKRSFKRCAVPRKRALVRDPTVESALRLSRHVIDLTPFFCSSRSCFPVVGGVLVHKDQDHLTQDFARTLGRYVLRAVDG
jgi:hypothetical protein